MLFARLIRNLSKQFEHSISSLFLLGGFLFDVFTLKRVDALMENLFILSYLFIIGLFIILIHLKEHEKGGGSESQAHFWYVNILQFAFGGVFSAYLILYFRSADIFVAWPFIALLAVIFIANEFLKKHYVRLSFQISLLFLSIYWFMIFVVPIIFHKIGAAIFLFSGLVSLILIGLFIKVLFYFIKDKFAKSKNLIAFLISVIFITVNFLYFSNLIPPIPLSLKDAGVYHSIQKNGEGGYIVSYENLGWKKYFNLYPDFRKTPGASAYAFSAVFSPKYLDLTIIHEWQHYDKAKKEWATMSVVNLPVVGGRDSGFRTYSVRSSLEAGKWRVNVKTEQGQTIGRMRFNIVEVNSTPELETLVK